MKVLDRGHMYMLQVLDARGPADALLVFVKRDEPAEKYPGNHGQYPGTTLPGGATCLR